MPEEEVMDRRDVDQRCSCHLKRCDSDSEAGGSDQYSFEHSGRLDEPIARQKPLLFSSPGLIIIEHQLLPRAGHGVPR